MNNYMCLIFMILLLGCIKINSCVDLDLENEQLIPTKERFEREVDTWLEGSGSDDQNVAEDNYELSKETEKTDEDLTEKTSDDNEDDDHLISVDVTINNSEDTNSKDSKNDNVSAAEEVDNNENNPTDSNEDNIVIPVITQDNEESNETTHINIVDTKEDTEENREENTEENTEESTEDSSEKKVSPEPNLMHGVILEETNTESTESTESNDKEENSSSDDNDETLLNVQVLDTDKTVEENSKSDEVDTIITKGAEIEGGETEGDEKTEDKFDIEPFGVNVNGEVADKNEAVKSQRTIIKGERELPAERLSPRDGGVKETESHLQVAPGMSRGLLPLPKKPESEDTVKEMLGEGDKEGPSDPGASQANSSSNLVTIVVVGGIIVAVAGAGYLVHRGRRGGSVKLQPVPTAEEELKEVTSTGGPPPSSTNKMPEANPLMLRNEHFSGRVDDEAEVGQSERAARKEQEANGRTESGGDAIKMIDEDVQDEVFEEKRPLVLSSFKPTVTSQSGNN